jgi:hypothetical protein
MVSYQISAVQYNSGESIIILRQDICQNDLIIVVGNAPRWRTGHGNYDTQEGEEIYLMEKSLS